MSKNSIFDIIKKLGEVAKTVQTDNTTPTPTENGTAKPNVAISHGKNLVDKSNKQPIKKNAPPSTDAIIQMINEHNRRAGKIRNNNGEITR